MLPMNPAFPSAGRNTRADVVEERFAAFHGYIAAARDALMAGRKLRGTTRRRTNAALGHAIAFSTWKSLAGDEHLDTDDTAALIRAFVAAAG